MPDKVFHLVTIQAELHNLRLILEQFQTILQSARRSNDRVIESMTKFIESLEPSQTIKNLAEGEKPNEYRC